MEDFKGTDHAENAQAVLEFATRHKVKHLCLFKTYHQEINVATGNYLKSNSGFVRGRDCKAVRWGKYCLVLLVCIDDILIDNGRAEIKNN